MALNADQRKSLRIGLGLILLAALFVILIWCGTYLPGFVGEVFNMVAGIMWSPFLLDVTLFFLGLVLILWFNNIRRLRDGDEFVYLEQVDDPAASRKLPAEARSAIYRHKPDAPDPDLSLAAIEGALDLPDPEEAALLLFKLPESQLDDPQVLALRLRLAELNGDQAAAAILRKKLARPSPKD
ncbi:MAG: hypothetical protein O3A87_09725 [Verrucomicrobia bacterium]|nr:hypothetical protein [Verrucomicrobiota bacterium]MDA1006737.1 hypothetical protein [Verrucomicrobiota bacterium]